ncbi:ATP-dependent DNA helicase PcrA [Aerococcus urinaehominis]|uniref:ATP-dependent DNA helicase PcrA n=1 Tax=Aerococcus urinaehominis TaxID=128944 RepID=A0A0X8FLU0_9LACT|nr:UvrD-helicase domain-containing protein [Aerococcus urinaehominis]AMB99454.1 ATP-dependent DNA helicase PcrA [Aerococcus urinaehominis]
MNQLLEGLNKKQAEAVQTTEGPLLVMAGAGSGKTRGLTHRMAYILQEKDVQPWNILAITFTNKAASEMKERVGKLVGPQAQDMWVSTFHAMCVRILRREAEAIGFSRNFTIADPAEQQTLIKQILKDLNLDTERFKPRMVLGRISDAKNNMLTPKDFRAQAQDYISEVVADCYDRYQQRLQVAQSFDFDDLIMVTVQLFESQPEILKYYQQKFHYIHVDEYQDTNEAQYKLVKLLADYFKNVCVVGDADQSIYGWRGANMQNILDFEKDYPQAQVILLEQNYRSTKNILAAANQVIENNAERRDKKLWTDNPEGEKIGYYRAQSEQDESYFVVSKINDYKNEGLGYQDMAVLYRTNAQSRVIEEALVKASLPYRMVGGLKFYDRKEIKDILAYLRLLSNPADNLSFNRIINVPKRGVGPGTLDKLAHFANQEGLTLLQAAALVDQAPISGKGARSLAKFADMMVKLQKQREFLSIYELTDSLLDMSGYRTDLEKQNTLEAQARLENIEEFLSVTAEFDRRYEAEADQRVQAAEIAAQEEANRPEQIDQVDLTADLLADQEAYLVSLLDSQELAADLPFADQANLDDALVAFLTDLSLVSDRDEDSNQQGQVTLMTLHAAKGLEFPLVFIIGMEDGIFPLARAIEEDDLEEERRLAYVGITRAERKLYLTNSYSRMLYGRYQNNPASRFIEEIDQDLLVNEGQQWGRPSNEQRASYNSRKQSNQLGRYQANRSGQARSFKERFKEEKRSVFANTGNTASKHTANDGPVNWAVGDKAQHKKWGQGTVVKVTGAGNDQELYIAFKGQGIKRLLAAFAPIEKV